MKKAVFRLATLVTLLVVVGSQQMASAISQDQLKLFRENINYFDIGCSTSGSDTASSSSTDTSNTTGAADNTGGLVWPFSTKSSSQYDRVDQGWDIQDKPSSSVYAIAPGTLHVYNPDPGNFGNDYPTEELDNKEPNWPSNFIYYGHVHILDGLNGKHVDAGQKIATTNGPGADVGTPQNGSGAPPGWLEIGFAQPGTDAPVAQSIPSPQGQKMKNLLINTSPSPGAAASASPTTATATDSSGQSSSSCCPTSSSGTDSTTAPAGSAGSTGPFVPDSQLPGSSPREKMWNYFISLGFTPVEAAGAMGNIGREGVYDPESVENGHGLVARSKNPDDAGQYGWGLFGFTPGHSVFTVWAQDAGLRSKVNYGNVYYISTQISIVYNYMKNVTGDGGGNMWKEYEAAATTPAKAASSWEAEVENAGVVADAQRDQFAQQAMNDFGNGQAAAQVSTPSSTSGDVCSCPTSGDTTLTGGDNEEKAYNYFVSKGLTPQQSAGIIGNLMLESGMDPTIVEGGSHSSTPASSGWGIAQWTPGTGITSIASAAHVSGPIDQLGTQLDILWAELTGNAGSSDDSQVLKDLKSTTTVEDAVLAFQGNSTAGGKYTGFERPADESASVPARTAFAKKALQQYGGGAGGAGVGASGGCSTTSSQAPVNIIKHDSFGNADGLMGHNPTMIGLHYTAGNEQTVDDVVNALADPTGAKHCNKNCSVQLTVDPKGNVYQLTSRLDVITENIINFNDADIGIEIMGPNENALLNDKAQFDAVTALVTQLMQQYNIPMTKDFTDKTGLMGHVECDQWSQAHLGTRFKGIYKNDPPVESTDSHTDPGETYMNKVRAVVGPALGSSGGEGNGNATTN